MILKTLEVTETEYEVIYNIPEGTEKEVIEDLQKHLDLLKNKPFDKSVSMYIKDLLCNNNIEEMDSNEIYTQYDFKIHSGQIEEEIEW